MKSPQIAGKKLVFAPVLRAGVTFAEGMLDLVPTARIAHIGLYREPETFVAVEYFFKAPSDLHERLVIVISPVLATANTAVAAVDRLKERGVNDVRLVSVIGVPKGVERGFPRQRATRLRRNREFDLAGLKRPSRLTGRCPLPDPH
jgi:uracil phosphoribosyltransferase